jgi:hypothetical protein
MINDFEKNGFKFEKDISIAYIGNKSVPHMRWTISENKNNSWVRLGTTWEKLNVTRTQLLFVARDLS